MIGHYLLTLTPEQESRVLTVSFGAPAQKCLCMVAGGGWWGATRTEFIRNRNVPGDVYEQLIARFSIRRVNAAIRNRILSNRARRELAPVSRETDLVAAGPQEERP